jgi:hypothetical protein
MKHHLRTFAFAFALAWPVVTFAQDFSRVPGTVLFHSPASTGVYLGSPAIVQLPDSAYLATHDIFGNVDRMGFDTFVYRSADRGATWKRIGILPGQRWSSLHVVGNAIYMIGVHGEDWNVVIRRSTDSGVTWTVPTSPEQGLLLHGDSTTHFHCGPMPALIHDGRFWRAMEIFDPALPWGSFRALVMSAPIGANLLDAASWTFSNALPHPGANLPGTTWLEGNIVLAPDGGLVNILRCHTTTDNVACVLSVSGDGTIVAPHPAYPSIPLPGACKKFTIRYDERTKRYWSLTNYPLPRYLGMNHVERTRNAVVLTSSADLRSWNLHATILEDPDVKRSGFQYLDWFFDGEELAVISRTAFDDGLGGAHDCHDANFITFHRVTHFRHKTSGF